MPQSASPATESPANVPAITTSRKPLITLRTAAGTRRPLCCARRNSPSPLSPSRRLPRALIATTINVGSPTSRNATTSVRVRLAAFVNSVRIKAITRAPRPPRRGGRRRVAGREEIQEGVFEALGRHDRLEPEPGSDERGGDVGAATVVQLDDEPVALDLHLRDARRAFDSSAARAFTVVDLDVDRTRRSDEIAHGSVGDEATVVHDEHVAADLFDLAEVVARQQHRRALRAEPADQLADLADLTGIEPVRRLVEHEQLGAPEQQPGESETLLHPLRVRLHLAVDRVAETGDRERAVEVGILHARAARLPPQPQVAHPGEVRNERGLLHHRADAHQLPAARRDRLSEQARRPARRPLEPHEHAQRRRLARAVRTEQPVDLTPLHGEREVLDRAHLTEGLPQSVDLDDRVTHPAPPPSVPMDGIDGRQRYTVAAELPERGTRTRCRICSVKNAS